METENTELAAPAVSADLALSQTEEDDMFGSSAPDSATPISFNNYSIVREIACFKISEDDSVKTLTGHILYKHMAKQYFIGEFDPANPTAPACYSTDGVKPAGGDDIQCDGLCTQCKHNAYGTAEKGKGKACKDTLRMLFLPEGAVLPVTITAPPTSLSKKGPLQGWLNSVMNDVAMAFNIIGKRNNAGRPIVDYWWAKVELSLEKKTFEGGEASILRIKTLDVLTPNTDENTMLVRALYVAKTSFTDVYMNELASHIQKADDETPPAPKPVQADEVDQPNEFSAEDEVNPFDPDEQIEM